MLQVCYSALSDFRRFAIPQMRSFELNIYQCFIRVIPVGSATYELYACETLDSYRDVSKVTVAVCSIQDSRVSCRALSIRIHRRLTGGPERRDLKAVVPGCLLASCELLRSAR